MLPVVSLNAVTEVGAGFSREMEQTYVNHMMIAFITGSPTDVLLTLEGSQDGVHWTACEEVTWTADSGIADPYTTYTTAPTGMPLRHVRANLVSFAGGTDPTFTATIASA
jgi:hypothetical protein